MLRVKDVNRLKVFGYELRFEDAPEFDNWYCKEFSDGGKISIDKETGIIGVCNDYVMGLSTMVPEELFELFAANLVERVQA